MNVITADNGAVSGSAGLKQSADSSGILALATGTGTTAVTIDASQNVGIGTSTPSQKLSVHGTSSPTIKVRNDTATTSVYSQLLFEGANSFSGTSTSYIQSITLNGGNSSTALAFGTNADGGGAAAERMRIDSSGNLLLGGTSSAGAFKQQVYLTNLATNNGILITNGSNTTGGAFAGFQNYVGTIIGQISQATSTTVNYATSSDYRLKDNVQPMTNALSVVSQLKPCTYTWKLDNSAGQGFIAHELAEVCPEAVVGEKDALDSDGNPKYQGIDTSFLVATLTAAIQEQQALITTLTERITALEAK